MLFPKKNNDALLAAVVGFFIVTLYTRYSGIGISPDSVVYMSVARNIHDHGVLMDFNNRPLVVFPAFYPVFLSIFIFISGHDPMWFAPALNALLFGMVIYTSGWIMDGFVIRSKWYRYIILGCIAFSPCLIEIYSMMWSETLFLLLLLLFIVFFRYYFVSHSTKTLVVVSVITALACVTRYAGITLAGTGGLLLLLDSRLPTGKKIRHVIIFGLISASLLALNIARNIVMDGTGTGMREKSLTSFSKSIYNYGNILCEWLPLPKDHFLLSFLTGLLFIICFGLLLWRHLKDKRVFSFETVSIAFFLVYSLFIILSATLSRYELISSRLLSPLFLPMLWGGTSWALPLARTGQLKRRLRVTVIGCAFFSVFQAVQFSNDFENYDGIKDAGIPGYTEDPWQKDSDFVNFIRQNTSIFKPGYNVYSNSDDALYFFTGLRCDMIPHKVFQQEINDFYIENYCYLVWFNDTENPELISKEDILSHKKMQLIYQCSNGSVYITSPPGPLSTGGEGVPSSGKLKF